MIVEVEIDQIASGAGYPLQTVTRKTVNAVFF
jgi:hypothetical protein